MDMFAETNKCWKSEKYFMVLAHLNLLLKRALRDLFLAKYFFFFPKSGKTSWRTWYFGMMVSS